MEAGVWTPRGFVLRKKEAHSTQNNRKKEAHSSQNNDLLTLNILDILILLCLSLAINEKWRVTPPCIHTTRHDNLRTRRATVISTFRVRIPMKRAARHNDLRTLNDA